MAEASIPVDLLNPGQVFACLGFMEVAELLLRNSEGGFDWRKDAEVFFVLRAEGENNPFAVVLDFLVNSKVGVVAPRDIKGPWPNGARRSDCFPTPLRELLKSDKKGYSASALPVTLHRENLTLYISSWLETPGCNALKLFAGKQIAAQIASNMLAGDPGKRSTNGAAHILQQINQDEYHDPFIAVPVGGRFGFDSRGAWDAMSVGWSLDRQSVLTRVSPIVELLAAVGLQNARPQIPSTYEIRYSAWGEILPVELARPILGCAEGILPLDRCRIFRAHLGSDQQYKKCFPAQEEPRS